MKQFVAVFISTFLVGVFAAPHHIIATYNTPIAPVVLAPGASQWHSQDSLGQYSYGYSGGPSVKSEVRSLDGITSGSYSYLDPENKLQTVNYVSDALGFRVAATNLPSPPVDNGKAPEPVEDTPEVKQAREEHLKAVKEAESKASSSSDDSPAQAEAPQPVEDTVEVKAAKEEHAKAHEAAKILAEENPDVPVAVAYHASPFIAHHPIAYSAPLVAVKTIVPSSFSYSVHTSPQIAYAQHLPYVVAA